MKKCFLLSSLFLCMLLAGTSSHAHNLAHQTSRQTPELQNKQQLCPTFSVSCPSDTTIGQLIDFKVGLAGGDSSVLPVYRWSVSGGEIVEGQGTPAIKVKMVGKPGQAIIATLQVDGFDTACAKTASCSMSNCIWFTPPVKFDSYNPELDEKARLDLFAAALKQQNGGQGYLIGYRGRRAQWGEAAKAVARASEYLIKKQGIDAGRIVTLDGGLKDRLTVDLWLVPIRSSIPTPDKPVNVRPQ